MNEIPSSTNIGIKTNFYEQSAASYGLTLVSELKIRFKSSYQPYFGAFCVKEYVKSIVTLEEEMRQISRRSIEKNMSKKDEENFKNAKVGWIYEQLFLITSQY